jgi:predicted ATP-binding protein involved in virulence
VHLVGYFHSRITLLHGFMNVNYTNLHQTTPTYLQRQLLCYYTSQRIKNFRYTFAKLEQSDKSSNMQTHQSQTIKCLQNSGAEHDALDRHNRRLRYVIEIIRSNHNKINWGLY